MPEYLNSKLHIGAAYYPEHWPEERWSEDIRLMREAGLTVMRIGEFAWSTMEPSAGDFHFEWLDRVISRLATEGIATVLGTPTAAPPAWLIQEYPDILTVEENGRRVQFGNRCHYCITSPEMRAATQRIVGAMAEHFGANPQVIGWQIDNELGRVCYCDRCRALFQQFLAERYGTLENLNLRWSTAYWSQTYNAWEQIPIPIGGHNPGLMLEFKRFITDNNRKFQKLQVDLLRAHLPPEVWITHNFMGWYDGFDHYKMSEDLDLASWDYYVGTGHHDPLTHGAIHDLTRGFKQRNFWVMETQPGNVNWSTINNSLNKGEGRAMAWQGVAHGADGILYWQWRSALGGQEQYHGTLVDQSGKPRPFYTEVQQLAKDFEKVSPLLAGSKISTRVAMLNSYESRWSIQWQRHHRDFDYVAYFNHFYRPLAARNISVDIISAENLTEAKQLYSYKMVIAPALLIINENQVKALKDFLIRGGHLVLTARCGMKDSYNTLLPSRQPGPLVELANVQVEDYYALQEPIPIKGNWFEGQAQIWAERLKVLEGVYTPTIAKYGKSNGWLDDQVAITVSSYKNSLVYYVGVYLDEKAQDALLERFLRTAGLNPPIQTPPGVEVCTRVTPENKNVYILINHNQEEKVVNLPWAAQEHLTGQTVPAELKLEPYGIAVLTRAG